MGMLATINNVMSNLAILQEQKTADDRRAEILKRAVEVYGESAQVDMCIEEMAELSKALLKKRRHFLSNPGDYGDAYQKAHSNIIEEIADVQIMLEQMRILYGNTTRVEDAKLDSLHTRLERHELRGSV